MALKLAHVVELGEGNIFGDLMVSLHTLNPVVAMMPLYRKLAEEELQAHP